MGPATLIPNIVSRTWQPATFISFSLLSKCVSADRLSLLDLTALSPYFPNVFCPLCNFPYFLIHQSSTN